MSELRKLLRQRIEGLEQAEVVSPTHQLAEYAAGMRQYEADKKAAEEAAEAEASRPQRKPLADELKGLIGGQAPTWKEVRAELDRSRQERQQPAASPQPATLVAVLKEALGEQEEGEHPSLNSAKLLEIASGTTDMPHSTRELLAAALRAHWDQREQQ